MFLLLEFQVIYSHLPLHDIDEQNRQNRGWFVLSVERGPSTTLQQRLTEKERTLLRKKSRVIPHFFLLFFFFFSESSSNYFWDRPDKVGSTAYFPNGTAFMRGPGSGTSAFLTHQRLRSRDFIKEDSIYILLTMEGM